MSQYPNLQILISVADAARRSRLGRDTVRSNLLRFQQGGIAAIRVRFFPAVRNVIS